MEDALNAEIETIERVRQQALDEGRDAVVYCQFPLFGEQWRTGSLSEIPDRYRNQEVSYHHHRILFSPTISPVSMHTLVQSRQHFTPIAPQDCLFLEVHYAGEYLRFTRLFASVWDRIPSGSRLFLKRYWETDFLHRTGGPSIKYVDWASMVKGRTTAWVYCAGHEIVFRGFVADRMPDPIVESLVAHELATVFAIAESSANGEMVPSINESNIEAVLENWELQPYAYLEWECEHKKQIKKWEKIASGRGAVIGEI